MKFAAIFLLACIAAVNAAPTSVSGNNVGNLVNVDVSGNLDVDNTQNISIINVLAGLLSQQVVVVAPGGGDDDDDGSGGAAPLKVPKLTPEMINQLKSLLTKH